MSFNLLGLQVDWHPVFWGFSLQFYFAVVILKTRWGYEAFKWLGDRVTEFLSYSDEGAAFLFGSDFRVHFFAFAVRRRLQPCSLCFLPTVES